MKGKRYRTKKEEKLLKAQNKKRKMAVQNKERNVRNAERIMNENEYLEYRRTNNINKQPTRENTYKKSSNIKNHQIPRKRKKTKTKKSRGLIRKLFLLIFLVGMIYSGYNIFIWFKENKQNNEILASFKNAITERKNQEGNSEYNIDFVSLKQKNPDTIGWLKVNGTDIAHPVVQTSNNDYYLTHSFDKSYNSAGWVFLNSNNKLNNDKNTVIFAHNRRDGSMFGTLKNILTEEWQKDSNNFKIPFITENEKQVYQVFSVYSIESEDYYITTNFKDDKTYEEFLNKIKSRSEKNFGVEVTKNDKILTLSTCANDNRFRVVLHAKKIL